jgi:hypothetical protein
MIVLAVGCFRSCSGVALEAVLGKLFGKIFSEGLIPEIQKPPGWGVAQEFF